MGRPIGWQGQGSRGEEKGKGARREPDSDSERELGQGFSMPSRYHIDTTTRPCSALVASS